MNTLAIVKQSREGKSKMSSKLLSGGDEKVLRLFEAPYNYVKTINTLNPALGEKEKLCFSQDISNDEIESRLAGEAKKQPLGLMNKPTILAAKPRVDEE